MNHFTEMRPLSALFYRLTHTRECSNPMRRPRPIRWIEEAEARQVVIAALSEAPEPAALAPAYRGGGRWTGRIRRWTWTAAVRTAAEVEAVPVGAAEPFDE